MQRNIIERCDDEISSLKQEIQELKEQYRENRREITFLSSADIRKALDSFDVEESNDDGTSAKNMQAKLAICEDEIQYFESLFGIEFTRYLKKTENKTEKGIVYSHKVLGDCSFLPFEMEFKTLDVQEPKRCEVIDLHIHMDCKENLELLKLISRAHTSRNLLGFFHTLSTYTHWCKYRQYTFSHFKNKYPLAVALPLGTTAEYMVLMNPDLPGCELILVWKITINEDGSVIPVLDLLPKIPEQARALDKTGVVENAAENFKSLLQAFGLLGTIDNLIHSFCKKRGSD
ncbi:centromere protein P-like isoform 1-T2 [Anomaloglossus baeobatrachus]|uniref:centromere protein P-like n=1 Tax=Anomaloglossus baeobatrachus TaxID=238106 RepID=UPI003F5034E4